MIKYNNKEYANFEQFAKCYQNRYKNANFDKVDYQLSDKAKFDKSDIALSGVYQLPNGKKFFATAPFEGNYQEISESGNIKNCNDSLQIIYLEKPNKKGKQIIKLNDSSQVDRTLQAMLDKSPTSVHAHGKKSKQITDEVIKAKFADFIEFCCQIGYFLPNVDVDDAIAKFTEKQQEEQKANEIDNIVKKMNVSIDVAEKIYNAMKA